MIEAVSLTLFIIAIVATAVAVAFTRRWKRRALDAELRIVVGAEAERHQVIMYRHMVRTLGGKLPHNPMYDGPEKGGD